MLSGLLALATAAIFAGAALYVNVAEHPARMHLDDRSLLVQWKPAYARGAIMQASLAIVGFLFGLLAWWQSGHWLWLAGAAAMIAPWPWTLFVIMPLNNRLLAMQPEEAGPDQHAMLERWNTLHRVRTLLGAAATVSLLWAALAH